MKKWVLILAFLLIPVFAWADGTVVIMSKVGNAAESWDIILPCEDNTSTTVVTNTEGANWTASVNTDTFGDGDSFFMGANEDRMVSPANWTAEKIKIEFTTKFQDDPAVSTDRVVMIDGGDWAVGNQEWCLERIASTEWSFTGRKDGLGGTKATTDHSCDTSSWFTYTLEIDATVSPWTVTLKQGETVLSWGAWSAEPAVATFNNTIYIGNGAGEPDAYFKDIKIMSTE